jgi:hypothetical protein
MFTKELVFPEQIVLADPLKVNTGGVFTVAVTKVRALAHGTCPPKITFSLFVDTVPVVPPEVAHETVFPVVAVKNVCELLIALAPLCVTSTIMF